jgi:hypothetical protein
MSKEVNPVVADSLGSDPKNENAYNWRYVLTTDYGNK